ncbi:hypothetical protein L2E82_25478 [Cichorium intybus]|uniref:Uncharacterized protein n=1 Tax=Cichorium intybus TaxID=13427 RepID=A0ACB9E3X8_CICIN|nr:hypothetical protein L2E82_25478 [Cichorium intybus]
MKLKKGFVLLALLFAIGIVISSARLIETADDDFGREALDEKKKRSSNEVGVVGTTDLEVDNDAISGSGGVAVLEEAAVVEEVGMVEAVAEVVDTVEVGEVEVVDMVEVAEGEVEVAREEVAVEEVVDTAEVEGVEEAVAEGEVEVREEAAVEEVVDMAEVEGVEEVVAEVVDMVEEAAVVVAAAEEVADTAEAEGVEEEVEAGREGAEAGVLVEVKEAVLVEEEVQEEASVVKNEKYENMRLMFKV